jgi:hypothetical protein
MSKPAQVRDLMRRSLAAELRQCNVSFIFEAAANNVPSQ